MSIFYFALSKEEVDGDGNVTISTYDDIVQSAWLSVPATWSRLSLCITTDSATTLGTYGIKYQIRWVS